MTFFSWKINERKEIFLYLHIAVEFDVSIGENSSRNCLEQIVNRDIIQ